MRVFVTGGTGFIGAHVVSELLGRGDEVTILTRSAERAHPFEGKRGVSITLGSLADVLADAGRARAWLAGHQACVHAAVWWDDLANELQLVDARAALALFVAAAEIGVDQFVYTSSTAAASPAQSMYAATKASTELLLAAVAPRYAMRWNVIRPGPTVGVPAIEGAPVKTHRRIAQLVEAAWRGEPLRVPSGGRQFIGAADLAKVYAAVLRSGASAQTYVAVAREAISWERIGREIVAAAMSASTVTVSDSEHASAEAPLFDPTKLERELGLAFDGDAATRQHIEWLTREIALRQR